MAHSFFLPFKICLKIRQGVEAFAFEFADPALRDVVDRHRIDEMPLFAALAPDRDEIGLFQNAKMFRHRLAEAGRAVGGGFRRPTL